MVEQDHVLRSLWFSLLLNYPLYLSHFHIIGTFLCHSRNMMTLADDKNFNFRAFKDIIANQILVGGDA